MSFRSMNNVLPKEIVTNIYEYDNTYILRMNNVNKQIQKLNKDMDEYWNFEEMLNCMTEKEENNRLKLGLPIRMDWPLPNKRCFRFWNMQTPTLAEVTPARDHWWLYQYDDGCHIYPTNNAFNKKKI